MTSSYNKLSRGSLPPLELSTIDKESLSCTIEVDSPSQPSASQITNKSSSLIDTPAVKSTNRVNSQSNSPHSPLDLTDESPSRSASTVSSIEDSIDPDDNNFNHEMSGDSSSSISPTDSEKIPIEDSNSVKTIEKIVTITDQSMNNSNNSNSVPTDTEQNELTSNTSNSDEKKSGKENETENIEETELAKIEAQQQKMVKLFEKYPLLGNPHFDTNEFHKLVRNDAKYNPMSYSEFVLFKNHFNNKLWNNIELAAMRPVEKMKAHWANTPDSQKPPNLVAAAETFPAHSPELHKLKMWDYWKNHVGLRESGKKETTEAPSETSATSETSGNSPVTVIKRKSKPQSKPSPANPSPVSVSREDFNDQDAHKETMQNSHHSPFQRFYDIHEILFRPQRQSAQLIHSNPELSALQRLVVEMESDWKQASARSVTSQSYPPYQPYRQPPPVFQPSLSQTALAQSFQSKEIPPQLTAKSTTNDDIKSSAKSKNLLPLHNKRPAEQAEQEKSPEPATKKSKTPVKSKVKAGKAKEKEKTEEEVEEVEEEIQDITSETTEEDSPATQRVNTRGSKKGVKAAAAKPAATKKRGGGNNFL